MTEEPTKSFKAMYYAVGIIGVILAFSIVMLIFSNLYGGSGSYTGKCTNLWSTENEDGPPLGSVFHAKAGETIHVSYDADITTGRLWLKIHRYRLMGLIGTLQDPTGSGTLDISIQNTSQGFFDFTPDTNGYYAIADHQFNDSRNCQMEYTVNWNVTP